MYYLWCDRRLSAKLVPTLRIESIVWSAQQIPMAIFSVFRSTAVIFAMNVETANFSDMLGSQLLVTIHCHDYIMKPENTETACWAVKPTNYKTQNCQQGCIRYAISDVGRHGVA
jgi:hypothetical protein